MIAFFKVFDLITPFSVLKGMHLSLALASL